MGSSAIVFLGFPLTPFSHPSWFCAVVCRGSGSNTGYDQCLVQIFLVALGYFRRIHTQLCRMVIYSQIFQITNQLFFGTDLPLVTLLITGKISGRFVDLFQLRILVNEGSLTIPVSNSG